MHTLLPYYSGWGRTQGWEAGGGWDPSLSGLLVANLNLMGKLLTRKQQWRRTRTRKHAWGDLPPEVLEAMLAACSGGMSKSLSWDQSYLSNMKLKPNETVEESTRRVSQQQEQQEPQHQNKQESTDATDSRAGAKSASGGVAPVLIPRSVSCSSLSTRRILFPRSSSRDELGEGSARRVSASQRRVLGRRGVSFDTQVSFPTRLEKDFHDNTSYSMVILPVMCGPSSQADLTLQFS